MKRVADVGGRNTRQHPADIGAGGAHEVLGLDRLEALDGSLDLAGGLCGVRRLGHGSTHDHDGSSGLDGVGGRLGVDPPRYRDWYGDRRGHAAEHVERSLALHLLVDGHVYADVRGAHGLDRARSLHDVGHLDHVDYDAGAVVAARLHALADRRVGGGAEDADHVGSSLRRVLHLGSAGVHGLHVGDDGLVGPQALEFADRLKSFALDEWGARLQPVGSTAHRFFGHSQGARKVYEIQGDLDDRALRVLLTHHCVTPMIWTTILRSRGRVSKHTKTASCHVPRVRRPSTNGITNEGPSRPARTWECPLPSLSNWLCR